MKTIFEVFLKYGLTDTARSCGIFSTEEKAKRHASKVAEHHKFSQISDGKWGEEDCYGLMFGVYYLKRKMDKGEY